MRDEAAVEVFWGSREQIQERAEQAVALDALALSMREGAAGFERALQKVQAGPVAVVGAGWTAPSTQEQIAAACLAWASAKGARVEILAHSDMDASRMARALGVEPMDLRPRRAPRP